MDVKDTSAVQRADSGVFPFRERKRKLDGSVQEFDTELMHQDGRVTIVKFVMARGSGPPRLPVPIPPGSVSYGYFWPRRPYNLYRMLAPDGGLLGHRFDAVADVKTTPESVTYRDLLLDWWAHPDDTLIEEDRDEFDTAIAAGTISAADAARAVEAAYQVLSRYRHIIDEAVQLERRWIRS
jgi:hypothetical protein